MQTVGMKRYSLDLEELGPQRERTIIKHIIVITAPMKYTSTVHFCMEKSTRGWGAGEGVSR